MKQQGGGLNFSGHHVGLDGVRGLAILGVMATHFVKTSAPQNIFESLSVKLAGYGGNGVDLFFVLSGFLITGILIDTRQTEHYFRNFYARRTLRIFPLYFFVLFAFLIILPIFMYPGTLMETARQHQIWLWTYTSNFYIAKTGHWTLGPFSHFWTLAIEEHFYLFWPFVIFFARRSVWEKLCVAVMGLALLLRLFFAWVAPGDLVAGVITPCRVDAMCMGALLASIVRSPHRVEPFLRHARLLAIIFLGVILGLSVLGDIAPDSQYFMESIRQTFIGGLFVIFTFWGINHPRRPWLARIIFENRILRFFGRYSYGLYVYHGIFTWYWQEPVTARLATVLGHHTLGWLARIILGILISVLVSWLSYEFFEKRFLALKRFFEAPSAKSDISTQSDDDGSGRNSLQPVVKAPGTRLN